MCVADGGLGGQAVELQLSLCQAVWGHGSCVRRDAPRGCSSRQAVELHGGERGVVSIYKGLDGGGYLASVFCSPPMAKHQAQTPA